MSSESDDNIEASADKSTDATTPDTVTTEATIEAIPAEDATNVSATPKTEKSSSKTSPVGIIGRILIGLVILAAAALIVFDTCIRTTYGFFYDHARAEFNTPGINSGFVPQDLDYLDMADTWLFSGYTGNDLPSPIWRLDAYGNTSRIGAAYPDGSIYTEHGSGITSTDKYVFLTCEGGYLVLNTSDVTMAKGGSKVRAIAKVDVGFDPAFINVQDGTLYIGVFYMEEKYPTSDKMHIDTLDGSLNHAVMYAYGADASSPFGFSDIPQAVYSIPDKVQGVCLTPTGNFVFSTSWGLDPSHLLVHNAMLKSEGTYDVSGVKVPLFCFDSRSLVTDVEAPPMTEGVIMYEDRVFVSNESACNKYIFGKLYGGSTIYSIAM